MAITNAMDNALPAERWVGTWACAPQLTEPDNMPPPPGLEGNTLRQLVRTTIGGAKLRFRFSNQYGQTPLRLRAVHVGLAAGGPRVRPETSAALLFGGGREVLVPPGEEVLSDPIDFALPPLADLAISVFFGEVPSALTGHPGSRMTSFIHAGDAAAAADWPADAQTDHWYVIHAIDTASDTAAAIVTLGDSITDGRGSTTNGNDRWPDKLARRLQAQPATRRLSVLNMGIGGNAVVSGGLGPTALERFDRDALERAGTRYLILLEGVNDIGSGNDPEVAQALIAAFRTFIRKARGAGIRVYAMPILPFGGSFYDSPAHAAAREAVNAWIRTSGEFDAVIDADIAVSDPADRSRLLAAYDSGDLLHLSPAGYRAVADSIDLGLFA